MGILIYAFFAAGLGCWLKLTSRSGLNMLGLRLSLGYAAMLLIMYVAQAVLSLPGAMSFWLLFALAAGGIIVRLRSVGQSGYSRTFFRHPVWLLLAAGGVAVIVNGSVDYLPVSHDEFSHWLANPIKINAFGSWVAARDSMHLADYPPGWPLLLALPWQVSGNVNLGAASTAPFVLHVAAIGLVFDVVVFLIRKRLTVSDGQSAAAGWAFILLFLAAETLGPLWPTTLLIEPPQFLSYTILILLLFANEVAKEDRRTLEFSAGIVLASCYLIKSAALIYVPAIIAVFLLRLLLRPTDPKRIRNALISCTLVTLPAVLVAASWGVISEGKSCLYSPLVTLSPEALATAGSLDWRDLADRYTAALWDYISSYKAPLTIAATIGMVAALSRRNFTAPLALGLMGTAYLALLYWYHLSCFGPFYFENLNSTPRFTRVLLRTLHGVGLVMLLDAALCIMARCAGNKKRLPRIPTNLVTGGLVLTIVVLGAWQMYRVHRSVDIVTARTEQSIDFRVGEMRQAAALVEKLKNTSLPPSPTLQVVSQGMDSAIIDYAQFFALSRRRGDTKARYKVARSHSWSPKPINVWQTPAKREDVRMAFEMADIIWPTKLDPWLRDVFAELVDDDCLRALPGKALIRVVTPTGKPRFSCIDKTGGD
jgi:hypothetical protein